MSPRPVPLHTHTHNRKHVGSFVLSLRWRSHSQRVLLPPASLSLPAWTVIRTQEDGPVRDDVGVKTQKALARNVKERAIKCVLVSLCVCVCVCLLLCYFFGVPISLRLCQIKTLAEIQPRTVAGN